ncbi:hypothetical protein [Cellulomonas sp. ATA003]|uniref:hypothetical protein n=1 Tax=Cellulomonas sp. ATA003 TaxID=3073064 RepID=UPI00287388F4|nr:hypothetical protein [Cellulomonas sp. ATA003]WNB84340.1 hypothetical protein REH70_10640 [Cellulomonas sp. ATA003]
MDAALSRLHMLVREASRLVEGTGGPVPLEVLDRVVEEVRRVAALGATPDDIAVAAHLSINDVRRVLGVGDAEQQRDRFGHTIWAL